jgi:hypothetical protein
MPSIVIVEKLGELKTLHVKTWNDSELYKKAGFKNSDGFKCYTAWNVEIDKTKYCIELHGKTTGRANQENKYEFPPPVDSVLFFGNCVLINKSETGEILNLTVKEWEEIYETLYGGFEDLGNDSDDESQEDEDDFGMKRTKDGYVKDGFVVDGDESEESEDEEEEDEDEEKIYTKTQKPKTSGSSKVKTIFELKTIENEENYLDCASELSEEDYIE